MVAPLAPDQEVARRVALEAEAGAARERDRGGVAGLDVGLDAVQRERAEGVVEDLLEPVAHQPLAGVASAAVVAEEGRLERAADDLGDVEDARDVPRLVVDHDEAGEVVARAAREQLVELVGALGRIGPRPVQLAALAHHLEEGLAVGGAEEPDRHARHCAPGAPIARRRAASWACSRSASRPTARRAAAREAKVSAWAASSSARAARPRSASTTSRRRRASSSCGSPS